MESAPRLRKRKAVEYTEDDENESVDEGTPKKKIKTVAKASKVKENIEKVKKCSKPKASTSSKGIKKTEAKETKTSRSKPIKTTVENNVDIDFNDNTEQLHNLWDEAELLSQIEKIPLQVAKNLIGLLTEGCTLPFIARYRKTAVDNLMPDRLQELHESYENITHLKKKVKSVIETLKKTNKLTPDIEKGILNARNLSELDLIYAPLKSHSLSLAERARNLGLEPHAVRALNGDKEETRFTITSNRTKSSTKDKVDDKKKLDNKSDPETYKLYFDWKCPSHFVKPHQTLALNRGEDEKILSVKVIVPDWFYNRLERFCLTLWKSNFWVRKGLGDAYNRLIKPWLSRHVRSDLTASAQKEAVKTFTTNLEKYLLTEPIKNRIIMGLDPGFRAGCKKLDACTVYPDLRQQKSFDPAAKQIRDMISQHGVELIGLGNGTACRETELWLKSNNICDKVPIIIVPEQGASIYSVSKEAQKEHPNMDPNLISALSIARRVLDPLGELIKVEPKNLGVGMYQHDIPPKMLETALDSAVEKVVSLVGVDINTASQAMLRRISGLNEGRAKKIIEYRQEHNGFESRAEILKVTGIGKITFQQCAGFLTVLGSSEPLDTTIIHPESYKIAKSNKNIGYKCVVRNVVPFGCFVDCGVGDNGLIHRSNLGGHQTPKLGDRVAVTVIASPKPKKIQLRLDKILD
ncbi:hypothetical protein HF086_013400 [Spodoptera exigua]|uniref:S1 motif domain-containing protein n=1 Tax=Spodoptera exigua TaxID=7107 RepID=A0A922MK38_SPOEX|nr:hypothetical protein HF086_013400 [Spodoptera exigua]